MALAHLGRAARPRGQPPFAWDVFTDTLRFDPAAGDALLAGVFSAGLLAFVAGILLGGRVADTIAPRRLALVALGGTVAGLLTTGFATSAAMLFATFGVLVGGSTGTGYAIAVRVAGTVGAWRGLALGLVVSAYATGTALLAPLAGRYSKSSGAARPSSCSAPDDDVRRAHAGHRSRASGAKHREADGGHDSYLVPGTHFTHRARCGREVCMAVAAATRTVVPGSCSRTPGRGRVRGRRAPICRRSRAGCVQR